MIEVVPLGIIYLYNKIKKLFHEHLAKKIMIFYDTYVQYPIGFAIDTIDDKKDDPKDKDVELIELSNRNTEMDVHLGTTHTSPQTSEEALVPVNYQDVDNR